MPLYEYLCESCGRTTEILQRMDEPPITLCPHCGGAVKKQFSAPAFHLKGSGWYATDYAKKSGGGERSTKSGESGGSGSEAKSADSTAAKESAGDSTSEAKKEAPKESKSESKGESKGDS